jgi:oligopeptide transport system ATP-binding protein
VAVMYAGSIVERAPVREIFESPAHPYTRGLLASMPGAAREGRLRAIEGSVPVPAALPPGCPFEPRCPDRMEICVREDPAARRVGDRQSACCHLYPADDVRGKA